MDKLTADEFDKIKRSFKKAVSAQKNERLRYYGEPKELRAIVKMAYRMNVGD